MTENRLRGKIAITGTGRSGTSFLVRLLTAYDPKLTGYPSHDREILPDVQAGMERVVEATSNRWAFLRIPRVWKDPGLMTRLSALVSGGDVPDLLVVPVRAVEDAAASRIRNNRPWFPREGVDLSKVERDEWPEWATQERQEETLREGLGRIVEVATLNRIPLLLVSWEDLGDVHRLWTALSARPLGGGPSLVEALDLCEFGRFQRAHAATWGNLVDVFRRRDGVVVET